MFCVECGKEGELIGSLCIECFSSKHMKVSLPDHVDLITCAHCSSMSLDGRWQDVGSVREGAEAAIASAVAIPRGASVKEMSIELSEKDERNMDVRARFVVAVEGHEFVRDLSTILRLKRGSCDQCSKQKGSYYEAVLQVRGDERSMNKDAEREIERMVRDRVAAMRKSSRGAFISKIERVKGGLDFYFSTAKAAGAVAREIQDTRCAEYKESSSLWGRRDGEEVYRMTYLVRMPGFARGDVVEFEGRDYFVSRMSRNAVQGIDLVTGEERLLKIKSVDSCVLAAGKSKILKAVVLVDKEREVQVLDPEGMSPLDIVKPRGFVRNGEQIRLVKTRLGAYVLSDSW